MQSIIGNVKRLPCLDLKAFAMTADTTGSVLAYSFPLVFYFES